MSTIEDQEFDDAVSVPDTIKDSLKKAIEGGDVQLLKAVTDLITSVDRKSVIDNIAQIVEPSRGKKEQKCDSGMEEFIKFGKDPEPRPNKEYKCIIDCFHPALVQSGSKTVFVHSIVVPCDIPFVWAFIGRCHDLSDDSIIDYLKTKMRAYVDNGCRATIMSRVTKDLLHPDFAKTVSDKALHTLLNRKIDLGNSGLFYDPSLANVQFNFQNYFPIVGSIAMLMNNIKGTPGLVTYQKIVTALSSLPRKESDFLQHSISCRFGPITDLAASVTVENVDYWMGKLKLATTTQLLDQLFRSPSVAGKCAAIFQLLEIHEFLWRSIDMSKVHSLVALLYRFFSFMMSQAKVASEYAKQGFEWVAAKFRRREDEPSTFSDVDVNLPETETDNIQEQAKSDSGEAPSWRKLKDTVSKSVDNMIETTREAAMEGIRKWMDDLPPIAKAAGAKLIVEGANRGDIPVEEAIKMTDALIKSTEGQKAESIKSLIEGVSVDEQEMSVDLKEIMSNILKVEDAKLAPELADPVPNNVWKNIASTSGKTDAELRHEALKQEWLKNLEVARADKESEPPKPAELIALEAQIVEEKEDAEESKVKLQSVGELIWNLEFCELGTRFLDWIKSLFSDAYKFFAEYPLVASMLGVVYSILAFCGFTISEFKDSKSKKTFCGKISASMKDLYYASRGKDVIVSSISNAANLAADMMNLNSNPEVEEFKDRLEKLHLEVNQLVIETATKPGIFVNDPAKMHEFKKTMKSLENQYNSMIKLTGINLQKLSPIWNQLSISYQKLLHAWAKFQNSGGIRQEPVVIWLWGATNLGKSTFAAHLVNRINALGGTKYDTFHISQGPDYWNGYAQQAIIQIDDFGAYVGQEGCMDALAVMNLATSANYNPNMANLEDKEICADPKFLIICSNHPSIPMNSGITDIIAFERRRDMFVHVTWPIHDKCPEGSKACGHYDKLTPTNFDHLKFVAQDPICSRAKTRNATQKKKIGPKDRLDGVYFEMRGPEDLMEISAEEIAVQAVERCKEKRVKFQKEFDARLAAKGVQSQSSEIASWEWVPNVMISGPPGCGKSYLLRSLANFYKDASDPLRPPKEVLHIQGLTDFEVFYKAKFQTSCKIVIIDDVSSHVNQEGFGAFLDKIKERYDVLNESIPMWICGANPFILDKAVEQYYGAEEAIDMFYRRFAQFVVKFNRKRGFKKFLHYNRNDVLKAAENKTEMDELCSYTRKESGSVFTYQSLQAHIRSHSPTLISVPQITSLPIIREFEPDAVCKLNCTSDEFVNDFLNSGSVSNVISFMTGDTAEFHSKVGISKMDIGKKILKTYRDVKVVSSAEFQDMYTFVLESWVNGFFEHFSGHNYLMMFGDISFYIRTVAGVVEAGVFEPLDKEQAVLQMQATLIKSSIESFDMAQVVLASLPPWFCLAMQCCAQVIKIGASVATAAYVVKQNTILFRAQQTDKMVNESKEKYLDRATEKIGSDFERAVVEATPLYPKKPGRIATIHHATITDGDYYEGDSSKDFSLQDDTPGARHHFTNHRRQPQQNPRYVPRNNCDKRVETVKLEEIVVAKEQVAAQKILDSSEIIRAQQAGDPSLPQTLGAVMPNMVQMCDRNTGSRLCYGLMLYGKVGTTVAHLLANRKAETIVVMDYKGNKWDMEMMIEEPASDRMDFRVTTKSCPNFRNIVNHLSSKDFQAVRGKPCVLFTLNKDWFGGVPTAMIRNYTLGEFTVYTSEHAANVSAYSYGGTRVGYTIADVNTFNGDCGSLLIVCDPQWPGKVLGIHTAANKTTGFAREIYKEQYETAAKSQLRLLPPISPTTDMHGGYFGRFGEFLVPHRDTDRDGMKVEALGTIKQFNPVTTKLWLSPIPYGPKLYEPSMLDKWDGRNPENADFMYNEAMKWCKPRKPISEEDCKELDHCFTAVGEFYGQVFKRNGNDIRFLTKTEALNKFRGSTKSNPIVLSTSPGYPWNVFSQGGKRRFIDVDENTGMRHFANNQEARHLINAVDDLWVQARKEEPSFCVFKVCLKDELLKIGKTTRTIAAAPLHLVIAARQIFHTVHTAMAENWAEVPSKVGIDAASFDWHVMFSKMLSVSDRGFAFDYKGWDVCVPPEMMERMWLFYDAVFRMACPNYTPEMRSVIKGMYKNIAGFRFLLFQRIYKSTGGMASGHPGTATDNSVINTVNLYFMFRKIMKKIFPKYATFYYFMKWVAHADYGDDIFASVIQWLLAYYNGITVSQGLAELGWVVTSADKTKPIVESIPLWDCEFMSRSFKRLYGLWVGPLRIPQIVKCTHYTHTRRSHIFWKEPEAVYYEPDIVEAISVVALKEMFLHGREEYDSLRQHFINAFAELKIDSYVASYEEAYDNFFGFSVVSQVKNPTLRVNLLEMGYDFPKITLPPESEWKHFGNRSNVSYGPKYKFSGYDSDPLPIEGWSKQMLDIVNGYTGNKYNSILVNKYPIGGSIPFHQDNEPGVDKQTGVACLTIQGDGVLCLKYKDRERTVDLEPGSFYMLQGQYIYRWLHGRFNHTKETISLTFRKLRIPG